LVAIEEGQLAKAKHCCQQNGEWCGELTFADGDGARRTILSRWTVVFDTAHQPIAILSVNTDITEKKELESRLLRSQRMESIGALAGGIAHDLNNALAPVMMCAEMLRNCDPGSRDNYIDLIVSSSQRATGMVKQILAFGRGTNNRTGRLSPSHLVKDMAKMVRETFPKSITVRVRLPADESGWFIKGDATEFHQILLNFCVNARDAMPSGGELTLAVSNVELDAPSARTLKGKPGRYVMVSVKDTGAGIAPEILPRIFEPFFTTKLPDKGTGLGLATVADIVRHHHGMIDVATKLYQGTEFKIYLPAVTETEGPETEHPKSSIPFGCQELILIVDDEAAVRELVTTSLESWNYRAASFADGVQALSYFEQHAGEIKVVITDIDMPEMDGVRVTQAMRRLNPEIGIILASGSPSDTAHVHRSGGGLRHLGKPFAFDDLLRTVSTVLAETGTFTKIASPSGSESCERI
jgi:signal transduction histidine kinase/CheY-like chemotaxis protein